MRPTLIKLENDTDCLMKKPKDIMENAEPDVRKCIEKILEIERDYLNYRNLTNSNEVENELVGRILNYIRREVS